MEKTVWPDLGSLPGIAEAVQQAGAAVAAVHRHPANQRGWPGTAAAASVRAARASAALAGADVMLDFQAPTVRDPVLAGALRVAAGIVSLVPVWPRAPLQVLARLHTLAAVGLADPETLGRPRADGQLGDRLAALAQLAVAAPWPTPVVVAVVHGELLALRPFGTADGVVARAAARIAMMSGGLDPRGLTVPEVGHLRARTRYELTARAYGQDGTAGLTAWIVEVCRALVAGAREGDSLADAAVGTPESGEQEDHRRQISSDQC